MKKLFALFLFLCFGLNCLSFYQEVPTDDYKVSSIAVMIDGKYSDSIPKQNEGYLYESSSCNNGASSKWDNEKWNLKISNLSNTRVQCNLNFKKIKVGDVWEYNYESYNQEFLVPVTGKYKIELWGSEGAYYESIYPESQGRGAYTSGEINLNNLEKLYLYVGGMNSRDTIYNGGGYGEAPGGSATDIRLVGGNWDNFGSLKSRIMVAAGGGGGTYNYQDIHYAIYQRGDGGALNGFDADICIYFGTNSYETCKETGVYGNGGKGATQTSGGVSGKESHLYPISSEMTGSFGIGGYQDQYVGPNNTYRHSASGGGSGYYGGGHGTHPGGEWPGGGGGSSFVSGYAGCNAIAENSTKNNIVHTGQPNHYSGKVFQNSVMKAGNEEMPNWDGTGTMVGNSTVGHAKITYLGNS